MKILVVEDEKTIAHYIKKGLEFSSHIVDVAYDGVRGYDLACSETYDVVILDRMLPELSGMEVCARLRQEKNQVPILMLTAKSQIDDIVEGLNVGADDYLPKPFEFAELVARVNALSRRPQSVRSDVLKLDTLVLDLQAGTVTRSKKPIALSKKEFSLLEFLVRNAGQVFTKEQLTERVWSYDSDVLGNTAQVYIGYLRKKIDTAFPSEHQLLHTIRGFGYTIKVT